MQQIKTLVTDMKELVLHKIRHNYLNRNIQSPYIDEDKLLLIISMLEQHGLTKKEMEDFVVTTMLIQIALDTHENVSNSLSTSETDSSLKPRQLTVLAGIYYSSLYYKILSDTSNLAMIRLLSEGIKEINEHKILFYQNDIDEIDRLMNSIMIIESALLSKLAAYFQERNWNEISPHTLLIKRLLFEKNKLIQEGTSPLFEALMKIEFPNFQHTEYTIEQQKYLVSILDRYIQSSKQIIEENIQNIPPINETLKRRFSILLHQIPNEKTFVEEG
ncbi:heptaprenyl diphosphate synthase component 1 [Bacillus sp. CGMCC 1.16607]|uniref:heptaprenyl diphosphate synthase component 1 n=1 Tax=Bacillus sp. CGMCC 1.16607 TaxID=3351842 RepID=UPI0036322451